MMIITNICLQDGCYEFEISDSYQDGICCDFGEGSWTISDEAGEIVGIGGSFESGEQLSFCTTDFIDSLGCTNPAALNFDDAADIDDGSCIFNDNCSTACGPGTYWDEIEMVGVFLFFGRSRLQWMRGLIRPADLSFSIRNLAIERVKVPPYMWIPADYRRRTPTSIWSRKLDSPLATTGTTCASVSFGYGSNVLVFFLPVFVFDLQRAHNGAEETSHSSQALKLQVTSTRTLQAHLLMIYLNGCRSRA